MHTSTLDALLPVPVVIPIAGAVAVPLLVRVSTRAASIVAVASVAAAAVFLGLLAPQVYTGHDLTEFVGGWGPVNGSVLGVTLTVDAWGLTFAIVTAVIGTVIVLFMSSEESGLAARERGGLIALTMLLVAALIGGALTADLVNLFVWFEVAALASYPLTAFFLERPPAVEAAFKVLALTSVAGFLVFIAIALLYASHGAVNLGQLHNSLATHTGTASLVALALLVAGFATKAGLVPFHGWLPDAHSAAPGPVSALFSGLMVNFGIVAIGRVIFDVFPSPHQALLTTLMILGVVSALGGALFALLQHDLKRLLAYDTISQLGVIIVGLTTANATGLAGATYHLASHALFKTLLFLCAGAIVHATGATRLDQMAGMGRRMPWVVGAFAVAAAAIAGVPPLNGFVSIGLIHDGLRHSHDIAVYVCLLVAQAITVAALGRCVIAMLRRRRDDFERDERLRTPMLVSLIALAAGCLATGIAAEPLLAHAATPAAAALLDSTGYAHAALANGGPIRPVEVSFDWANLAEYGLTALTIVGGAVMVRLGRGRLHARPLKRLRTVQTGSVNDYLGYQFIGLITLIVVLVV